MTANCADPAFSTSRDRFEQVCSFLGDQEASKPDPRRARTAVER